MATLKSFKNYDFENCDVDPKYYGDYPHVNFFKGEFIPVARKEMKKIAEKAGAELVSFNPSHFYFSAFFKRNDKFIYVNVGDVRYERNWYDDVLIRTAKNEKDFTGGTNNFCSIDELAEYMNIMFDRGW